MNRPGDQLFPCPGLPLDEHGHIGFSDGPDHPEQLLHLRALTDDPGKAVLSLDFSPEADILQGEAPLLDIVLDHAHLRLLDVFQVPEEKLRRLLPDVLTGDLPGLPRAFSPEKPKAGIGRVEHLVLLERVRKNIGRDDSGGDNPVCLDCPGFSVGISFFLVGEDGDATLERGNHHGVGHVEPEIL